MAKATSVKINIRAHDGFTLLELMLVMALIGLVMATVRFTVFNESAEQVIAKKVSRLQVVFNMASDYAVINQEQLGLRIDEDEAAYEFVKLDADANWVPMEDSKIFKGQTLPENVILELSLEGLSWEQDESLFDDEIFDEELSVSNDSVEIGEEDEAPPPPQVLILSSGEITPFELKIDYQTREIDERNFYFLLQGKDTVPLLKEGPL